MNSVPANPNNAGMLDNSSEIPLNGPVKAPMSETDKIDPLERLLKGMMANPNFKKRP